MRARQVHFVIAVGLALGSACSQSPSKPSGGSGGADAGSTPGTGGVSSTGGTTAAGSGGAGQSGTAGSGGGSAPTGGSPGATGGTSPGTGGATIGAGGTGGTPVGAYAPPAATRSDVLIDANWRFLRSDATGASGIAFNDTAWTPVTLPHTWNASDGQDGGSNYYRGIGWYRRNYAVPAEAVGKKIFLQFDAANIVADVYVNGTLIGQHRGGFSRFRFDVTSAMVLGIDNVIAVRVNNAPAADVPPLSADFTFFGGLYRDAHVLITDNLHIDAEDNASSGVYLDTSAVSAASAGLRSRVRVKNSGTAARPVTVDTVIVRADGTVQTRLSVTGTVPAGATQELAASATIANPHLWDGVRDPYLYTAYVELRAGTQVIDWVTAPLGFRFFAVDPAQGFLLNGRYLDLHGVDRHQDRLNLGWAIGKPEHEEDIALIGEMGANVVRLSHYQHADYFHELGDRAGIILWAEIPLVNDITASTAFTANATQQLTELIRQNYNHPSILFWGIGNEQRTDTAPTNALLTTLNALVHTEDPSRLSTYAQCCTSDTGGLPAHTDIVGYNTYYGWYAAYGTPDQFGPWADNLHALRPTWKIGMSEYGAGAALTQHADAPVAPDPYGLFHPEEWQNLVHEAHWKQMKTRPFLWAKIIWNMFDFAVDSRNEGDTPGRNDKGMVSYDRKTRKDAFFWYKANWTDTPVVYISSRRFTTRTTATVPIKVYSNLDSVALRVNGTAIGAPLTSTDHIFTWPSIALNVGANVIQTTGTKGTVMATDTVTWTR